MEEGRRQRQLSAAGAEEGEEELDLEREVSVAASFVSGDVVRCAAPRWAHAATTTLRVAIYPAAAADAADADAAALPRICRISPCRPPPLLLAPAGNTTAP